MNGLITNNCCCRTSCAGVDCSWHPCRWDIAIEGGTLRRAARVIYEGGWRSCDDCPSCPNSWTDPNCDLQNSTILAGCSEELITFSPIDTQLCLVNEPPECVCYYELPDTGFWNRLHETAWCGDWVQVAALVNINVSRTTTVTQRFCGSGQCITNAGSQIQNWSWTEAWYFKAQCNPLLGPFGQQFTDGRISFGRSDILPGQHPAHEPTPFSEMSAPPATLFPVPGSAGLWSTLRSRLGGTFVSDNVSWEFWGWPGDAEVPGVLEDVRIPEFAYTNAATGVEADWGDGMSTDLCTLNYVDPSGLAATHTSPTYGVLGLTAREIYIPQATGI